MYIIYVLGIIYQNWEYQGFTDDKMSRKVFRMNDGCKNSQLTLSFQATQQQKYKVVDKGISSAQCTLTLGLSYNACTYDIVLYMGHQVDNCTLLPNHYHIVMLKEIHLFLV